MHSRKASQRGCRLVKDTCNTAGHDTTSDLPVGNGRTGAPVTVPMSGFYWKQPGWNRGILCIPPLIFIREWVFFIPSPQLKGGN